MRAAYKCRAYPDEVQVAMLSRTFGCIRVVWNRTLAWRHARYHAEQLRTSFGQASAYLTVMKKDPDLEWLNEVPSVPLQRLAGTAERRQGAGLTTARAYPGGVPDLA